MNLSGNVGKYSVVMACMIGLAVTVLRPCQAAGPVIQSGSTVTFHYTLTVKGKVADTTVGKEPMTYVQGRGQLIPGLEQKMMGMQTGEKKRVTIAPKNGYGLSNPNMFQKVPRETFGVGAKLKVGDMVTGRQPNGNPIHARVVKLNDDEVTLDLNHPLAGKTLQFDVEIVSVKSGG